MKEYYIRFFKTTKVMNKKIIEKLEKNKTPEKNAIIDKPLDIHIIKL